MSEKYTDVDYEELDDGVYYTAVQVAEIVGEEDTTIRSWAKQSVLGDVLNIKKVNGRNKFTKADIEKFKFVKELRDKNYSVSQIREYISKQGFEYGEYDSGLINPKDPLGFEALSIMLTQKQDEKLDIFKKEMYQMMSLLITDIHEKKEQQLSEFMDETLSLINEKLKPLTNINKEVAISVENVVIDKMNNISTNTEIQINKVKETVSNKLDSAIQSQYTQNKAMLDSLKENVVEANKNSLEVKIEAFKRDYSANNDYTIEKLSKSQEEVLKSIDNVNKQVRDVKKDFAYLTIEKEKKGFFERVFGK